MPTTPFTNVVKEVWADLITLPHTPNGTLDPTVIYQDDSGGTHLQKKDLSAYRKLFCAAGSAEEGNAVVIQSSLNTTNSAVTTNSTDIGDNAADITTNQGNITTNQGNITTNQGEIATVESMVDASVRFITFTVDFQTNQTFESTYVCGVGARVQEVRLIIDGSVDQRTPVGVVFPSIAVQFKNGATKTIMEWSSAANVEIPAGIVSIPQWTANDGGSAGGDEITVLQQAVTFQNNATPSYTVMVGVIETALT